MIAAEACGSLTQTFLSGSERVKKVVPRKTIARHVLDSKSSYKGYRAIKDSDGMAVTASSDDEILSALLSFAKKEGIFFSTTSAVTLVAIQKLKEKGYINSDTTLVCVMTAGGLKDPDHIENCFPTLPDPIEGNWEKFKTLMKAYYNVSV